MSPAQAGEAGAARQACAAGQCCAAGNPPVRGRGVGRWPGSGAGQAGRGGGRQRAAHPGSGQIDGRERSSAHRPGARRAAGWRRRQASGAAPGRFRAAVLAYQACAVDVRRQDRCGPWPGIAIVLHAGEFGVPRHGVVQAYRGTVARLRAKRAKRAKRTKGTKGTRRTGERTGEWSGVGRAVDDDFGQGARVAIEAGARRRAWRALPAARGKQVCVRRRWRARTGGRPARIRAAGMASFPRPHLDAIEPGVRTGVRVRVRACRPAALRLAG
ncbi:hypothetical protein CAL29_30515 [Bordetella genomosp. 10]|uniref:Uncharacterized protein n=1 Tax=Bordetella genomosp. 10 TaxID=1416804 RepID=A0A261S6V0_9BORD|nr:hypothetical protein CAL29_30515 [Bordetella genomosp. 10]